MSAPALLLSNLSVALQGRPVLKDIHLTLQPGETGVLLGATGSGKTTLLRCIAGLQEVDSGTVEIAGQPAASRTHLRGVGLAPQQPQLLSRKRVCDNIALGLRDNWALGLRSSRQQKKDRLAQLAKTLDIEHLMQTYPAHLSGGEARLVCIAQALAPNQSLILLDEPSAGLDTQRRQQLPEKIRSAVGDKTALLLTTHDCVEAFHWADKIGVIADGRLAVWTDALSLWRNPQTPEIVAATGMGDLLQAKVHPATTRSQKAHLQVETAAGDLHLPAEKTTVDSPARRLLLVRPGGLQLVSEGAANARILHREIRSGQAGLSVELLASGERCWLVCADISSPDDLPQMGERICLRLLAEKTLLL